MAVELKRLVEKVANYDISLIAGEKGLRNIVSWVHMVETEDASCFLDGKEIAFITGVGLKEDNSLFRLVKTIFEHNASGIIINIGPFIEDIPSEIISFCNDNSFPLFTVPWKIHLAEIIKIFCSTISKDEQHALQISSAFKNAILFPKQEELYTVYLSQNGFMPSWCYNACAIRIADENDSVPAINRLESICFGLENYLTHHKHKLFATFPNNDEILVVIANHTSDECKKVTDDIISYLELSLAKNESYLIGVGRATKSIRCLFKSYNQAHAIQKLNRNSSSKNSNISYNDMGLYRLLIGIEDPDIIRDYYANTLKPLEEYDKANSSDLCKILKTYLLHDGSVKETADELFVHRNTINYKLNKISELLDADLSSMETRVQLYLAFKLESIL